MSVPITTSETVSHAVPSKVVDDPNAGLGEPLPCPGIRQMPISVTLDGIQVSTLALALAGLIHFSGPSTAMGLVALVPVAVFIHNDYQNFLGLGRGGTPYNFRGYLMISFAKLYALWDPFTARKPDPDMVPSKGILTQQSLPYRTGPRPHVVGIAPHRQANQKGSPHCFQALQRTLEKLSLKNPKMFEIGRSFIEKQGLALFARNPIQTGYQGEVCHVHDAESSMHMALHPDDAKEVFQKGWGQRHPLGWKWRFIRMPVVADFVMVYAPRGEKIVFLVLCGGILTLYR